MMSNILIQAAVTKVSNSQAKNEEKRKVTNNGSCQTNGIECIIVYQRVLNRGMEKQKRKEKKRKIGEEECTQK